MYEYYFHITIIAPSPFLITMRFTYYYTVTSVIGYGTDTVIFSRSHVLEKIGKRETIVVETTQVENTTIGFTLFYRFFMPYKTGIFNVHRCKICVALIRKMCKIFK